MSVREEQELEARLVEGLRAEDRAGGVSILRLLQGLGLPPHARRRVRRLLQRLQVEGRVTAEGRGRYRAARAAPALLDGVLAPGGRGDLRLLSDADGRALARVPLAVAGGAVPGDRVRVRLGAERAGRGLPEARVEELLARGGRPILGTFWRQGPRASVLPNDDALAVAIRLEGASEESLAGIEDGDLVAVTVDDPRPRARPAGRLVEVLGRAGSLAAELARLRIEHGLSADFPAPVVAALARLPAEAGLEGRADLRAQPFVTIDPDSAKDFDDAVWAERLPDGFRLEVAIADVAAFVPAGSALDQEAARRGLSVYLPGTVFPMLPAGLSEARCSLSPGEDRAVVALTIELDGQARPRRVLARRALFRSSARLTYAQAQAALDGREAEAGPAWAHAGPLRDMAACAERLLDHLKERGALDFDLPESEIELGPDGRPLRVRPAERLFAHRLVEAFMVAANEAVGEGLTALGAPLVYRAHAPPEPEKLEPFLALARALGAEARFGPRPSSRELAGYLRGLRGHPAAGVLEHQLLRSLMQARYQADTSAHFGLASACYLHFTSPIRRYPDLVVHRQLGRLLAAAGPEGVWLLGGPAPDSGRWAVSSEQAALAAEAGSQAERRASAAEREAVSLYQAAYLEDRLGEELPGRVSFPTEYGAFVRLEPSGIEGLVHVSRMLDDHYQHDPLRLELRGRRTGRVYRLGQPVRVRVESVSLARRQVDLAFL